MARGQGFEPRLQGPEPCVLPLDDPRMKIQNGYIVKLSNGFMVKL